MTAQDVLIHLDLEDQVKGWIVDSIVTQVKERVGIYLKAEDEDLKTEYEEYKVLWISLPDGSLSVDNPDEW